MPALHDIQSRFRDALLHGDTESMGDDIRTGGLTLSRRLGIYRNNVFTNQREALRTIYSVVDRLVGSAFFDHLADEYIRHYASPAGDLNRLGEHMAAFLAEFPGADELVYLPDTAALEWLAHEVYHGPDHSPLDVESLAAVPAERYEDLRFRLHPASALFTSPYPVHRIWQLNQPGYMPAHGGASHVDLDSGGVRLLIERRNSLMELRALEEGEWIFLLALAAGRSFGQACDEALAVAPGFDLDATFSRLIADSTLVDFVLPAPALT